MNGWKDVRLAWLGFGLILAGTIPALWAVGELSEGLVELPRHWWSTLSALPFGLGIVTTAVGLVRLSRSSPPS